MLGLRGLTILLRICKQPTAILEFVVTRERWARLRTGRGCSFRSLYLLSPGPQSEQGKRISSLNAVKTGLTGQTVLLPSDDAALYERHVQRFIADHQPEGDRESELVQSMADAQWRMNRIPGLEMAVFARGRIQFAEKFAEYDERMATALTDAETLFVYQRELRNLQTQESRIRRRYQKDLAELKELQTQRASANVSALPPPPPLLGALPQPSPELLAKIDKQIAENAAKQNGFEFSKIVQERASRHGA